MSASRWLGLAGAALALAVLLGPLALGQDLRRRSAQRQMARHWPADLAVLPLLSLAHARAAAGARSELPALLDSVRAALKRFRGPRSELLWLELARLEAVAGRRERARADWQKALSIDPRARQWLRGPDFAALRRDLGPGS